VAKKKPKSKRAVEVNVGQLDTIIDKASTAPLESGECQQLRDSIHAMAERLIRLQKSANKSRSSEKKELLEGKPPKDSIKRPRRGHGRNGVEDYTGATKIEAQLPAEHQPKKVCPDCEKGKLHHIEPAVILRIKAMPPIQATVYNLESCRCRMCGAIFRAEPPEGIGDEKYDDSVAAMVAQLKYGTGMPFNRIDKLQEQMGIPLPAATQFELVNDAAVRLEPLYEEYLRQSAQGSVLTHDDTEARILDKVERPKGQNPNRTGLKTTGVVSQVGEHQIALFITGPRHAGENMGEILKRRAAGLPEPICMADALPYNDPQVPPAFKLVLANCLTHGRRQFVDIYENFPEKCHYVIEQLSLVYHYDDQAAELKFDAQGRLAFHQRHSRPVLDALKLWMESELGEKKTEPNSGLGKAINYFLKRWDRLTRFLAIEGAPLDSNVVERALKKSILHRKNSLFFKTQNGADVGDLFMSIIHTCELNGVNSFDYLCCLLRNVAKVRAKPSNWMPWNFRAQLQEAPC
jgi:transposase